MTTSWQRESDAPPFARLYAYIFYVVRKTYINAFVRSLPESLDWYRELEGWKVVAVPTSVMMFAALAVTELLSQAVGYQLLPQEKERFVLIWCGIFVGLYLLNSYAVRTTRRMYPQFEKEFRQHPKAMRVFGGVLVWSSLILVTLSSFWLVVIGRELPPL